MTINRRLLLACLAFLLSGFITNEAFSVTFDKNVVESVQLVHEAKSFEEQGHYEKALIKYNEALAPRLNKYRWEEASARGGIVKVYMNMKRYDLALKAMDWFLEDNKNPKMALERIREIKELQKYQKTHNPQGVFEYIEFYKQEYKKILPPTNWIAGSDIYIVTVLRLYDTIGDYDSGIKFIDEILAYFRTGKAGSPKPGKVDAEYMKIREAFEKDKAEGTRGRATKALIQSNYFPW